MSGYVPPRAKQPETVAMERRLAKALENPGDTDVLAAIADDVVGSEFSAMWADAQARIGDFASDQTRKDALSYLELARFMADDTDRLALWSAIDSAIGSTRKNAAKADIDANSTLEVSA